MEAFKPKRIIENGNFIVKYNMIDEECINDVLNSLEENYKRVSTNLNTKLTEKIIIEIYHNRQELHKALGLDDNAPDWIRGGVGTDKIIIASPLNPPPGSKVENVINTAVHEFTHIIISKINWNIPRWLNEGIASYEGKDNSETWIVNTLKKGIKENLIPRFKDLDTESDFNMFFKRDGYQYSYTIVEFIVNTFGYDKLYNLIKSSCDYEKALNITEDELEKRWIEFIKDKYKA